MTQGITITNAYGQEMFSSDWKSLVFGGSTNHSGAQKVSVSSLSTYGYCFDTQVTGGYVDFRIEDPNIAPNLSESDDTPFKSSIIPFISAPAPVGVTHLFKAAKSGVVNGYFLSSSFVANAGVNTSSVRLTLQGWSTGSSSRGDTYEAGMYYRGSENGAAYINGAGTITVARCNRMIPHLCVGDVFQFSETLTNGGPTSEALSYAGVGTSYTVTEISTYSAGTFTVKFTPARASAPVTGFLCVRENLKKVFVRCAIQLQAANANNSITPSQFNMYYFRPIREADKGTNYGINVMDAAGNITFTSNVRPFRLSALGVTTPVVNTSNPTDPKTGDWLTVPFMFGTTPANYAIYAPILGSCFTNYTASLTPGTGRLTALNTGTGTAGWSANLRLSARTTAGSSSFHVCKVGPHSTTGSSYPSAYSNEIYIRSSSYVMVIDTSLYQP